MKKTKSKMGRPKKPANEKQSATVAVNLTPGEYARLRKEAKQAGLSLSAYLSNCWKNRRT